MEHRKIPELEDFVNEDTDSTSFSIDEIIDFAQTNCQLVNEDRLLLASEEAIGYIQEFSYLYHKNRFEAKTIKDLFDGSIDTEDLSHQPCVRFIIFIILVELDIEDNADFEELKENLDYCPSDYKDHAVYYYYRSRIYNRGYTSEDYRISLKMATQAIQTDHNITDFDVTFVDSVAQYFSTSSKEVVEIEGTSKKKDELFEQAKSLALQAVESSPENHKYRSSYASLLELDGDLDEAQKQISKALRLSDQQDDPDSGLSHYMQLRRIQTQQKSLRHIKSQFDTFEKEIQTLENRATKLRGELDEYRNQTIRIMGFFAALIAIVVSSAQVIQTTATVGEAAQLVLVLTGGLIVAFTSLGAIFSNEPEWKKLVLVGIVGLFLIAVALAAPILYA